MTQRVGGFNLYSIDGGCSNLDTFRSSSLLLNAWRPFQSRHASLILTFIQWMEVAPIQTRFADLTFIQWMDAVQIQTLSGDLTFMQWMEAVPI